MLIGAGAQLILGKSAKGIDWTLALVAGLIGFFVGLLITCWQETGSSSVTPGWHWYSRRSEASHA